MTRILAIRPEPGLSATLATGRELGLEIAGTPLFEIRPAKWDCPAPEAIDALLIGSANAILHGGEQLRSLRAKPVHAVGETTAKTAREAGFAVASCGTGGLQKVLDAIPAPSRLLRIAGTAHVPLSPPEGVIIHTVIAYESVAGPLPESVAKTVRDGTVVLLHSAAAAEHFANQCSRLALDKAQIELAVLGPRIAAAAGEGWRAIHTAARSRDRDLLEMVAKLCE